ncbi:MAG: cytochrome c3 family protein [Desulfuromonadaceae bacterium]|nr:cytochrome c3 family protein [Desulfuromonadaceae bacterium]
MKQRCIKIARSSFFCASVLIISALVLCVGLVKTVRAEEIVCIPCHSGLPEKFSAPVKLWQKSIHAENGIACNACHGGDPKDAANAMSPARGFLGVPKPADIPAFCGRCHVGVLKNFLASAHGRALGKGGPTCVTCHGNHRVLKVTLDLINEKTCSQCHTFERARKIRDAMAQTEARIVAIDNRISEFKKTGTDTEIVEKQLFSLRNGLHSLSHVLEETKLTAASTQIDADLTKIESSLNDLTSIHKIRKIAGVIVVSAMLMTALLLHLMRKTY